MSAPCSSVVARLLDDAGLPRASTYTPWGRERHGYELHERPDRLVVRFTPRGTVGLDLYCAAWDALDATHDIAPHGRFPLDYGRYAIDVRQRPSTSGKGHRRPAKAIDVRQRCRGTSHLPGNPW